MGGEPTYTLSSRAADSRARVGSAMTQLLYRQRTLGAPLPRFPAEAFALIPSMRLSLKKGAHADLSGTAWQEIAVKPCLGLSGTRSTQRPSFWLSLGGRRGTGSFSNGNRCKRSVLLDLVISLVVGPAARRLGMQVDPSIWTALAENTHAIKAIAISPEGTAESSPGRTRISCVG
jgi:hypothetical protein